MDVRVSEENWLAGGKPDRAGSRHFGLSRLRNYCLLFLFVGLAAGLVTWGILTQVTKQYTSVVYLRIGEGVAHHADSLMHSAPVLDAILAAHEIPGSTIEERRQRLDAKRSMTAARGELISGPALFRQDVTDPVPARARELNAAFVSAWLLASKPLPHRKEFLEADIRRIQEQIRLLDEFIDRFRQPSDLLPSREPAKLLLPSRTEPRSAAQPQAPSVEMRPMAIANLLAQRNEGQAEILQRNQELLGVRPDVVLAEPTLPEEASWPRPRLLIPIAIATTELVLLLGLVLWASLSRPGR